MVVCEGGFVASTIASIMMNGVCCLWQMEEEKEKQMQQREAFRRDIRVEYERQRQIEQEIWEARRRHTQAENWYHTDASSVNTDQRRRKLIAAKTRLVSQQMAMTPATNRTQHDHQDGMKGALLVQKVASPLSRQPIKKRKVRLALSPTRSCVTKAPSDDDGCTKTPQQWNDMSSLMDSAFHDDDDDDDDDEFDDDLANMDLDQEMNMMMMEDEITSLVDIPLR